MFLKIHHSQQGGDVVAVCDRELLNTTVLHGDIEVPIKESFYGNRLASEDEVREALLHAYNANLIGERAVALAIDMGLITRSGCILIGAVPHALLFRL
jgi:uncharacterized protein